MSVVPTRSAPAPAPLVSISLNLRVAALAAQRPFQHARPIPATDNRLARDTARRTALDPGLHAEPRAVGPVERVVIRDIDLLAHTVKLLSSSNPAGDRRRTGSTGSRGVTLHYIAITRPAGFIQLPVVNQACRQKPRLNLEYRRSDRAVIVSGQKGTRLDGRIDRHLERRRVECRRRGWITPVNRIVDFRP